MPTLGVRGGADLSADTTGIPPAEADPSMCLGLTLDVGLRPDTWFEISFERQTLEFSADPTTFGSSSFEVALYNLQLGASYGPARKGLRPYVTVAAGLTHFSASGATVPSSTDFSGSLGGGFQVPLSPRLGFRLEVRGYATLADAEVAVACGPGCVVRFASGGWYQLGARAGLAIRL